MHQSQKFDLLLPIPVLSNLVWLRQNNNLKRIPISASIFFCLHCAYLRLTRLNSLLYKKKTKSIIVQYFSIAVTMFENYSEVNQSIGGTLTLWDLLVRSLTLTLSHLICYWGNSLWKTLVFISAELILKLNPQETQESTSLLSVRYLYR